MRSALGKGRKDRTGEIETISPTSVDVTRVDVKGEDMMVITFESERKSFRLVMTPHECLTLCDVMERTRQNLNRDGYARRAAGNGPVPRIPGMRVGT